jgi:hypothetical protein
MQPLCVLREQLGCRNPHEGVLRGAMLTSLRERCQDQPTNAICSAMKNISGCVLATRKA